MKRICIPLAPSWEVDFPEAAWGELKEGCKGLLKCSIILLTQMGGAKGRLPVLPMHVEIVGFVSSHVVSNTPRRDGQRELSNLTNSLSITEPPPPATL